MAWLILLVKVTEASCIQSKQTLWDHTNNLSFAVKVRSSVAVTHLETKSLNTPLIKGLPFLLAPDCGSEECNLDPSGLQKEYGSVRLP